MMTTTEPDRAAASAAQQTTRDLAALTDAMFALLLDRPAAVELDPEPDLVVEPEPHAPRSADVETVRAAAPIPVPDVPILPPLPHALALPPVPALEVPAPVADVRRSLALLNEIAFLDD